MKHRSLLLFIIFIVTSFLSVYFLPFVKASESITLYSIGAKCVSNVGFAVDDLTVHYWEGAKWISFFAFNLSEIPAGSSVDNVVLKIKTKLAIDSAWVSAYSSSNAEWVETGMSWDSKPDMGETVDAALVSTHEEWYIWESSSFTEAVSDAFAETGRLTVMLKSGFLIDQKGYITFYPDAKLEITYTPETEPLELFEIPLWAIIVGVTILLGVPIIGVIVVIYFVRKRQKTIEPSGTASVCTQHVRSLFN